MVVAISSVAVPAGMCPGPHITVGTRIPPSQVVAFAPRSGPADPACSVMSEAYCGKAWLLHRPLSEV